MLVYKKKAALAIQLSKRLAPLRPRRLPIGVVARRGGATEKEELSPRARARRQCCSRRMRGVPIVDSFQGQEQVTFCGVITL